MDYAGSFTFYDDSALLSVPNVEILSDKSTEELVKEVQEKWPDYNIEPEYEFVRLGPLCGSAILESDDLDLDLED